MDISRISSSAFHLPESECRHGAGRICGHRKNFSLWRFLNAALVLIASLMSVSANAAPQCTLTGTGNNVVNAGSISVPANAAVGTTIAVLPPVSVPQSCVFQNAQPYASSTDLSMRMVASGANYPVPGFADVYPTNVNGVGARFTVNSVKCNFNNWVTNETDYRVCAPTLSGSIGGPPILVDLTVTVSFVVTGSIAAGASPLLTVPKLVMYDGYSIAVGMPSAFIGYAYSGNATGKFVGATCSVNRAEIPVSLPTADTLAFSAGIGTVAAPQSFNLSLACSAGSKVAITLTDNVNPANVSSTLQLSSESTAKGIGIQILNSSGLPISFGPDSAATGNTNQWMIGDAPNGQLNVPMIARYIRTGTVSGGTVKALATFTLSYQ